MCKKPQPPVPKSWTVTCLKTDGVDDGGICSRFFAPDGMVFKTVEEVYQHNSLLERAKLEKEEKKIFSFSMDGIANNGRFVENKIPCGQCDKKFTDNFRLKRHEEDVHKNPYRRRSVRLQGNVHTSLRHGPTGPPKTPPGPPQSIPGPPQGVPGAKKFNWTSEVEDEKFHSVCNNKMKTEANDPGDAREGMLILSELKNITVEMRPAGTESVQPSSPAPIRNSKYLAKLQHYQTIPTPIPPVVQPVVQPVLQPVVQPLLQPVVQPVLQPVVQPIVQPPSSPPGPPMIRSQPISGSEMLRAMQSKEKPLRGRPEKQERQEREVLRPETGRVSKVRSCPRPGSGKFSITVREVCRYFALNEFPLALTERSPEIWAQLEKFEKFYLPLVATVNPASDPLVLRTLVQAKWKEIMEGRGGNNRGVQFINPGGNKIRIKMNN